jgi:hypothetical protein
LNIITCSFKQFHDFVAGILVSTFIESSKTSSCNFILGAVIANKPSIQPINRWALAAKSSTIDHTTFVVRDDTIAGLVENLQPTESLQIEKICHPPMLRDPLV